MSPEPTPEYEAACTVLMAACDALLYVWREHEAGEVDGMVVARAMASVITATAECQRIEQAQPTSWPDDDEPEGGASEHARGVDPWAVLRDPALLDVQANPPTAEAREAWAAMEHAIEVMGPRPWRPAAEEVVRKLGDAWREALRRPPEPEQ